MPKSRTEKEQLLASLRTLVTGQAVVLTEYRGLTVRELTDLRAALRTVGASYTVTKNSLLRRALTEANREIPSEILDTQLAVATSPTDEVEPNRVVVNFARDHDALTIHGALVDGHFVNEAGVRTLAALPSRDELYAKAVGSIAAPLRGLVTVLSGTVRGLVTVLRQYQQQRAH
ncbi:50S ribosomal protein L10 [Candidatus Berkelbacteria bacterium]|nr:50S ribosomal protein L10 [Candidatus Berkelbacteria bacterium]